MIGYLQTSPKQTEQFKENGLVNTEHIFSTVGNYISQRIEPRTYMCA